MHLPTNEHLHFVLAELIEHHQQCLLRLTNGHIRLTKEHAEEKEACEGIMAPRKLDKELDKILGLSDDLEAQQHHNWATTVFFKWRRKRELVLGHYSREIEKRRGVLGRLEYRYQEVCKGER